MQEFRADIGCVIPDLMRIQDGEEHGQAGDACQAEAGEGRFEFALCKQAGKSAGDIFGLQLFTLGDSQCGSGGVIDHAISPSSEFKTSASMASLTMPGNTSLIQGPACSGGRMFTFDRAGRL